MVLFQVFSKRQLSPPSLKWLLCPETTLRMIGLGGTVLKWFASYLSDRCKTIKIGSTLSELSQLIYGIPQGSVLSPLLFSLYTTPHTKIIRLHPHIKFHFYADDTQLYIHLSHKNASAALAKLNACLHDVQRWMSL